MTVQKRAFAAGTAVSAIRSQEQIEATLAKYGATKFALMKEQGAFAIAFVIPSQDEDKYPLQVRFTVFLPTEETIGTVKVNKAGAHRRVTPAQAAATIEQETNRLWRSLALGIKAKLVLVDDGIETIDQALYAHVVNPASGRTVYEETHNQVDESYLKIGPRRASFVLSLPELESIGNNILDSPKGNHGGEGV